ncbi:MAG: hypothetical protein QW599_05505 [Nitrososphaerota archaeon]
MSLDAFVMQVNQNCESVDVSRDGERVRIKFVFLNDLLARQFIDGAERTDLSRVSPVLRNVEVNVIDDRTVEVVFEFRSKVFASAYYTMLEEALKEGD